MAFDKKFYIKEKVKEQNAVVKHVMPINKILETMLIAEVRRKDPTKAYGEYGSRKFYTILNDGHNDYNAMFDAVHENSFSMGDKIGFEANPPNEHNFYKITKKHKVCNITKLEKEETTSNTRPNEEMEHLSLLCSKRINETLETMKNSKNTSLSFYNILKEERASAILIKNVVDYFLAGKVVEENPLKNIPIKSNIKNMFNGKCDAQEIATAIEKELVNPSNGSADKELLEKISVLINWILIKRTHTHIAIIFNLWTMFTKRLKEAFDKDGVYRDEYVSKSRRSQSIDFLRDDAKKVTTEIQKAEQTKSLAERFSFLKEKKFIE